jgi:uncharacterized membrane protein YecN with MAPEG domain
VIPTIVPIYAAILALVFVSLSFRVVNTRRTTRITLGSGGNVQLERRIRVQGNFAEYVPLALILLTFIESQGWPRWLVHLLCLVLLAARLVHAYGVSQEPEDIRLRASAVPATFGVMIVAALLLLAGTPF